MTITYQVGGGLYINMTNRCSNSCEFCVREQQDAVGDTDSLWLEREPTREEIWEDIQNRGDLSRYDEIVFCGYGEPTERLDDMLWLCGRLRAAGAPPIRVNTNGHASLTAGRDVTPEFEGLIDTLSVSLNSPDADEYNRVCRPVFGCRTYAALLDFAVKAKSYVPNVILSVVEGTTDIEACRRVAEESGLPLRVRTKITTAG